MIGAKKIPHFRRMRQGVDLKHQCVNEHWCAKESDVHRGYWHTKVGEQKDCILTFSEILGIPGEEMAHQVLKWRTWFYLSCKVKQACIWIIEQHKKTWEVGLKKRDAHEQRKYYLFGWICQVGSHMHCLEITYTKLQEMNQGKILIMYIDQCQQTKIYIYLDN